MKKQHVNVIIYIMSISSLFSSLTACKKTTLKDQTVQNVIFDSDVDMNQKTNTIDQTLDLNNTNPSAIQKENQEEIAENSKPQNLDEQKKNLSKNNHLKDRLSSWRTAAKKYSYCKFFTRIKNY